MKIARVYFDIDLRCSFDGLAEVLKQDDKDIANLSKGDLVIFMNRKMTAFKMLAGPAYLVLYRNGSARIPLDAIQYLPTYFDGTQLEFTKAVEKSVKAKLKIYD